jgi:hypothetical protein
MPQNLGPKHRDPRDSRALLLIVVIIMLCGMITVLLLRRLV